MSEDRPNDHDYETLAGFRFELRQFLHFSSEAAGEVGLTSQQHQALLAIRAAPAAEMAVGELAERLLLRPHSATELLDRLVHLGLVERKPDADDRRKVRIRITARGGDSLALLAASHRSELRRLRPLLMRLIERL